MTETPIFDALIEMTGRLRLPLHVPGHKQGRSLPSALAAWLGQAAKLDLTELPGLDNLHAPAGCIAESQRLAAAHYGSERCFFSVNGSSAGVMAAVLAAARGGTVLFANACHQSAWRGLILAGADAVFLAEDMEEQDGRPRPPQANALQDALATHPEVTAVMVTSPTYQGVVADVAALAAVCHSFGVPLLVDEAHGAHFGLIDAFPRHSVECGADVVVQSVHKMLPGLTQTAWVHQQGPYVSADRLQQWLSTLQTTSPSYLLLATLDVAQAWLRREGAAAASELLAMLQRVGLVSEPTRRFDPVRQWIATDSAAASRQIAAALPDHGIYVEYADATGVLALFGFGLREDELTRYCEVLAGVRENVRSGDGGHRSQLRELYRVLGTRSLAVKPGDAYGQPVEWVTLDQAAGRIAGGMVTPYPPGVPVVVPGQRLDPPLLEALNRSLSMHAEVHGIRQGTLAVLSERR